MSDNAAPFEGGSAPAGKNGRRKREEKVRRPWRGSGWGYIVQSGNGEAAWERPDSSARRRYSQTNVYYTINGNVVPFDGRW